MAISIISTFVVLIIILIIASFSGFFSEKAGVINLSIEGFMCIGAIIYAVILHKINIKTNSNTPSHLQFYLIFLAGIITISVGLLYGFMVLYFKCNQTIAGIAINAFALALSYLIIKEDKDSTDHLVLQTNYFSFGNSYDSWLYLINSVVIIGIPIIIVSFLFVYKTKKGKMISGVGENPEAIESIGYSVWKIRILALIIASFLGGIAGAMYSQISQHYYGSVNGFGFIAVAIVIFGQWKLIYILGGAIFFGIFAGIEQNLMLLDKLSFLTKSIARLIPFLLSLILLIFTSTFIGKSNAPAALGKPYVRKGR